MVVCTCSPGYAGEQSRWIARAQKLEAGLEKLPARLHLQTRTTKMIYASVLFRVSWWHFFFHYGFWGWHCGPSVDDSAKILFFFIYIVVFYLHSILSLSLCVFSSYLC